MGKKKNEEQLETQLVKEEPIKDEELKAANTEDIVKALDDEIGSAIGFLESQGYKVYALGEWTENKGEFFPKEVFEEHEKMRFWGARMNEELLVVSDQNGGGEEMATSERPGVYSMEVLKQEAFKVFLEKVEKFENKEDFRDLVVPCFRFQEISEDTRETGFARGMAKRIHLELMQHLRALGFPSMYKMSVLEHRIKEAQKDEERLKAKDTEGDDDEEGEGKAGDDGEGDDDDAITSGYVK
jgi:hypothetical protein